MSPAAASDQASSHAGDGAAGASPWIPLRRPIFRAIWIASLASNLGTWMHIVAASWLMTSLTASAALVALVQTASALPAFALALPAGALADVLDRRRMIMFTQAWQLVVAASLGAITLAGGATPGLLLAITLALGVGAALGVPVFSAITAEIVPRPELPAAISLNSAAFTLAQALGPAIGGLLVAAAGAGAVFLLNAVSFLAVVTVVAAWRRAPRVSTVPPEHVVGAIRVGVQYVRHARPLRRVLLRLGTHVFFFSAFPALLVVVARTRLDLGAAGYGALFGCFGVGGATGAFLLPWMRTRLSTDRLVTLAATTFAIAITVLATVREVAVLLPTMVVAGVGSMVVISSLSIAAQSVLPGWVRGRGLAVYMLTFQAGMAGGAALWGTLAANAGVSAALLVAAGGMVTLHLVSGLAGLRLAVADEVDVTPAHWTEPQFALEPEHGEGPILIEIVYRIAGDDTPAFLAAMRDVRRTRRRDGAMQWSLYQDLSDPERHVETFLVASWAEHERQAERAVKSDRAAIERVLALQRGDGPHVAHFLRHQLPRGPKSRRPDADAG